MSISSLGSRSVRIEYMRYNFNISIIVISNSCICPNFFDLPKPWPAKRRPLRHNVKLPLFAQKMATLAYVIMTHTDFFCCGCLVLENSWIRRILTVIKAFWAVPDCWQMSKYPGDCIMPALTEGECRTSSHAFQLCIMLKVQNLLGRLLVALFTCVYVCVCDSRREVDCHVIYYRTNDASHVGMTYPTRWFICHMRHLDFDYYSCHSLSLTHT